MLNPLAHDFTPISAFPPEPPQIKNPSPKRKEEQSHQTKKKQTNFTKPKTKLQPKVETSMETASTLKGKKKDSQAILKKPQHRDSKNKNRNNKATQGLPNNNNSSTTITTTPSDIFAKESKFITIEAAIDPIRRIDEAAHVNSLQKRRQSTNSDKYQFEHGYERYIDWIDRSLRLFDTVTLVGMDNAVVDVISLVTILHDRKLGVHDGNKF
jgi:hypothetical protein